MSDQNPAIEITVRPDRAVIRMDGHVIARIYNGPRTDVLMKAKAYLKATGFGSDKTESEWLVKYD